MGFLGSLIGAVGSIWGAKSAAAAQQDSAHQRETADLKAAGLNPILSATGGNNGASSPSGAMISGIANPLSNASQDILSARRLSEIDKQSLKNQTDSTSAEVALKKTGSAKNVSDISVNEKTKQQIDQNILTGMATARMNSAAAVREESQAQLNLANARLADESANTQRVQQSELTSRMSKYDADKALSYAAADREGSQVLLNNQNSAVAMQQLENLRTQNQIEQQKIALNAPEVDAAQSAGSGLRATIGKWVEAISPLKFKFGGN